MSTAVFERTVVGGVGKSTILYPTAGDGDVREARIEIRDTLYGTTLRSWSSQLQNTNAPLELWFRALLGEGGAYRVEVAGGFKR
jgi:hypothetical protein